MHKDIKWADKELKGLTHDTLSKFSIKKLAQIESGKSTTNFIKNRTKQSCSKGGKVGGKTTGNKIKNGEKIGFFAIPMAERIEKYFSKPRPNRRLLSEKEQEYIQKVYYRPVNQFDKIPKGKKSIKYLMEKYNVGKGVILKALKNNYKK